MMQQQLAKDKIRERRISLGLSHDTAAARAGAMSVVLYRNIEIGHYPNAPIGTAFWLAQALECSVEDISEFVVQ